MKILINIILLVTLKKLFQSVIRALFER